ncbi:hypothetical protein L2D08_22560 [Domibacillus sp. PGB-M46]|uniref:hypothetical protein n=1 Tax=Domibacillus sp. PGB-M46 TaxID=2910255 RepID=UPI001F5799DE|nr:hypothetical protein [Domibacillus sp. PGB-M46]MCI2257105.1 hypothetical protein [Domibacillus sp. PGB-M46]
MKNPFLFCFVLFLTIGLFGCSSEEENLSFPKDSSMLMVAGNGLERYFPEAKNPSAKQIVFEQTEEIDMFIKAMKNSSLHSGPMTGEGENFQLTFSPQKGTSETFLLWLNFDGTSGRVEQENRDGQIHLLSEESVQDIEELLAEKSRR